MELRKIKKVLILGAGTMGWQLGLLFAQKRLHTIISDISENSLSLAKEKIWKNLEKRVAKGKLSTERQTSILADLEYLSDWKTIIKDVDLVIESIPEKLELKQKIFVDLSRCIVPGTICGTNSSSFTIDRIIHPLLSENLDFIQFCANIHFSNPPYIMPLVELHTPIPNPDLIHHLRRSFRRMHLEPVEFHKPVTGFIMNRLLGLLFLEAFKMIEKGICSKEDLDTVCTAGLNWPIGLMRIADLVGLDTIYNSLKANYEDTNFDFYKPPKILEEKINAGDLGMKTKKGFYIY